LSLSNSRNLLLLRLNVVNSQQWGSKLYHLFVRRNTVSKPLMSVVTWWQMWSLHALIYPRCLLQWHRVW